VRARGARCAALGFGVAGVIGGCASPPPSPSSPTVMLVVTYHGSELPGNAPFTTTPAAVASAADSQRCRFYTFDEPNNGGAVNVEVHLLVPQPSVPTAMAAIEVLQGIEGVRRADSSGLVVTPTSSRSVAGPYGCGTSNAT
jgi:hypothetical protein